MAVATNPSPSCSNPFRCQRVGVSAYFHPRSEQRVQCQVEEHSRALLPGRLWSSASASCRERGPGSGALADPQPLNPLSLLPVVEVEPGREGPTDDHGGRARVCHGADVPASRARLSGEGSPPPVVPVFVLPRGLLSRVVHLLPWASSFLKIYFY